jgi:hypothetical protein
MTQSIVTRKSVSAVTGADEAAEWIAQAQFDYRNGVGPYLLAESLELAKRFSLDEEKVKRGWSVKKISPPLQPEIGPDYEPTAADAIAHGLSPDAPKWFVRKIMQARGIKAQARPKIDPAQAEQTKPERKQVEEAAAAPTGSALVIVPQPQPEATLIPVNETPEETALRQMNNKHAVISNLGGKCVIMELGAKRNQRRTKRTLLSKLPSIPRTLRQPLYRRAEWSRPLERRAIRANLARPSPSPPIRRPRPCAEWSARSAKRISEFVERLGRCATQGQLAADATAHRRSPGQRQPKLRGLHQAGDSLEVSKSRPKA